MSALCKSCDSELSGEYCAHCGQKLITERLTVRSILTLTFQKLFDLENSFWITMKLLITNPAEVVHGYLGGATKKYYNPIRFAFISIAVVVIIMTFFGVQDGRFSEMNEFNNPDLTEAQTNAQDAFFHWMMRFMNLISLMVIPFYALISLWLYKRQKLNYAEHLAVHSYGLGIAGIISIPLTILAGLLNDLMMLGAVFSLVISAIYYTYFYKELWGGSYIVSGLKSLATVILGYILFYIIFIIIGIVVVGIAIYFNSF